MTEIAQLLKKRKREDSELSNDDIQTICDDCATLVTRFDDYFHILRTGTSSDKARAERARDLALSKLRDMGLSVTPKAHILERHAVEQMCAFAGGLQHLVEDWVERFHQTASVWENNVKRVSSLQKRAEAYGLLQEIIGNSQVSKRAFATQDKTRRKRKRMAESS